MTAPVRYYSPPSEAPKAPLRDDMDKAQHGRCVACGAPLCFGPYECCALFGKRWQGNAVMPGHEPTRRLLALDVCCSAPCIAVAKGRDRARLEMLVSQVEAQLLAVPLPDPKDPIAIHTWASDRARNLIAGLQSELKP